MVVDTREGVDSNARNVEKVKKEAHGEKKNGVDDRGSVHPSGEQIKVVKETRSSSKEKSPGI